MKVYKFFKIPDENDREDIDIERKYVLYAITNNKEYAKRFKEDRNMKKFIFKVHEDIDKDEYAEMCNNERGAVLELFKLTTVFDDNHTRKNSVEKEVLMTYWEKQMINEPTTLLDDESLWRYMPYPLLFKPKYQAMFKTLQYTTYYKLMTANFLPYEFAEKIAEIDDDYDVPSIIFDEVSLFIDLIKDTL